MERGLLSCDFGGGREDAQGIAGEEDSVTGWSVERLGILAFLIYLMDRRCKGIISVNWTLDALIGEELITTERFQ